VSVEHRSQPSDLYSKQHTGPNFFLSFGLVRLASAASPPTVAPPHPLPHARPRVPRHRRPCTPASPPPHVGLPPLPRLLRIGSPPASRCLPPSAMGWPVPRRFFSFLSQNGRPLLHSSKRLPSLSKTLARLHPRWLMVCRKQSFGAPPQGIKLFFEYTNGIQQLRCGVWLFTSIVLFVVDLC
jgi:hypothetical protein